MTQPSSKRAHTYPNVLVEQIAQWIDERIESFESRLTLVHSAGLVATCSYRSLH
jgi:predicted component of type VI protein secretion system